MSKHNRIVFQSYLTFNVLCIQVATPLKKVTQFDENNPSTFRMGPGNFSFYAEITDTWGAKVGGRVYQKDTKTW